MKIMIVDDAIFMRHMLSGIFEKAGHSVCGMAASGSEAIERFAELKPDLVTMDIIMPDMNGVVALKEIKKINPEINVLIISALGHKSLISEAVKALDKLIGRMDVMVADSSLWPKLNPSTDSLQLSPEWEKLVADVEVYHVGDENGVLYTRSDRILSYWDLFSQYIAGRFDTAE